MRIPSPPGIRVPRAVGDFLILRAVRESGGIAMAVGDPAIMKAVDDAARRDGLLLCPEGGATLAAYREALPHRVGRRGGERRPVQLRDRAEISDAGCIEDAGSTREIDLGAL